MLWPEFVPARVITVDAPWLFANRHVVRRDNKEHKTRYGPGAAEIYKRRTGRTDMGGMPTEDIARLGPYITPLCAPDPYLFLWVPDAMLEDGLHVMKAWGFKYIKTGIWRKKSKNGKPKYGTGRYMPNEYEIYLLGRRPNKPCWHPNTGWKMRQVLEEMQPPPSPTNHSKKPETFQDNLERWFGPYMGGYGFMELFATRPRPRWHCLGYEVTGHDIRTDLVLTLMDKYGR